MNYRVKVDIGDNKAIFLQLYEDEDWFEVQL